MKSVAFQQSGNVVDVKTEADLLQALLAEQVPVKMACGGRGICATCHVFVERGSDALTPVTKKETRTLSLLAEADSCSRLACQARVLADGVTVRLPAGLYIEKAADLDSLVGRRAETRILHPVDGRRLVEVGKIITRSTIRTLKSVESDLNKIMAESREV